MNDISNDVVNVCPPTNSSQNYVNHFQVGLEHTTTTSSVAVSTRRDSHPIVK